MAIEIAGFALALVIAAFAGGALGAAIGAIPSLGLAGVLIALGEITTLGAGQLGGNGPSAFDSGLVTQLIGYGPGFGPHVAFAGGVAATAYAARKGYLDTDFGYHEAKHVTTSLGTKPDVLLVGGVFGVVGHLLERGLAQVGTPVDTVMASVVVTAVLHRLVLGYPLVGRLDASALDMSPYESGQQRRAVDGGGHGDRLLVEPWLPHQSEWANVATLGFVAGLFGAFVALATGSVLLAFGIATTSLLFLALGMSWMPVTHHMVLPASIVAGALPNVEPSVALLLGGLFGLLAGVAGELAQRVFYAHADTHFDPPAVAIVLTTLLVAVLELAGVFASAPIPTL